MSFQYSTFWMPSILLCPHSCHFSKLKRPNLVSHQTKATSYLQPFYCSSVPLQFTFEFGYSLHCLDCSRCIFNMHLHHKKTVFLFYFLFLLEQLLTFIFLTQSSRHCLPRITLNFLKITHIQVHLKIFNTSVCSCSLLLIIWIIVDPRNLCNIFQSLASVFTCSNFCSVYSTTNVNVKYCI